MTGLPQRVEENLRNRRLLLRGQAVLAAVSGGLDSMVLLHALHELALRHRWKLTVAHFNHQLRGRSSDADERLVRRTAARLKLPAVTGRADVKAFARKSRLSIEMAARKLRHEFLARSARQRKVSAIAIAHHADDQVELFFLRLLRGAGGEGLAGMKWQSPSPADAGLTLVRPLLDCTREEIAAFARENKLRYREDATNASAGFLRNRIRNELLPLLRGKYQPALNRAVLRLMELVGAEAEYVGEAAGALRGRRVERGPERKPFGNVHRALQRRFLQQQLIELGVPADFDLVEQLRTGPGRPVSIATGLAVSRDASGRVILETQLPDRFRSDQLAVRLSGRAGEVLFDGVRLGWAFKSGPGVKRPAGGNRRECFDADRVGNRIILRHWRPGDRFQPIGMKAPVKLQDLFINAKIPRLCRRERVVAATRGGDIFWVEGLRISEQFKLTLRTRRRLVWHWQPLNGLQPGRGNPGPRAGLRLKGALKSARKRALHPGGE